ncbi:MAG: hypothetical protein QOE61_2447 [Micromonosporaceae bacterium]|nr:hypothetical protein [Micromonosporaceae bacterium]
MGASTSIQDTSLRVAWLLRVNRLLGPSREWTRTATFAVAFRGGSYPKGVSDATVSRWETGAGRATFLTLRRYEELLGVTPGLLVSTADTIYRYVKPVAAGPPTLWRGAPVEPGTSAYARLEALLERAVSGEEMSGWSWDELTGQLSATPSIVMIPSRLWLDLAGRLLEEMIVADGLAWIQRFEAMNRLLGHPAGREAAVAACVAHIADPTNEVFVEPMALLDASSHPDAGRNVLHQLAHPTNERTRYGALLACIRKVRFGHFTPDQLNGLVPVVTQMLGDPDSHADAGALGVEVVRQLPPVLRAEADAGLRRALGNDRTLHEVLAFGRLAPTTLSRVVVERIVRAVAGELIRDSPGFSDDVLPTLVDEMLYHPVFDIRLYAAMLIHASPYREPMAIAFAGELAKPQVVNDPTLATSLLHGLRVFGGARQRLLVERLVLGAGVPPEVSMAAVASIGHVGGVSSDQFWASAIALHSRAWRRHRARTSASALNGLVYALGMARNLRLLARIRSDEEAPTPVRASARWWLNRPARVYASVRS